MVNLRGVIGDYDPRFNFTQKRLDLSNVPKSHTINPTSKDMLQLSKLELIISYLELLNQSCRSKIDPKIKDLVLDDPYISIDVIFDSIANAK